MIWEHVLEAGRVGGLVGHETNLRGGTRFGDHASREFDDGDFLVVADVEDFAQRFGATRETDQRFNGVMDKAEAAGLFPCAIDFDGFAGAGGLDEAREDHAMRAGLARAHRVEQAGDHHGQAILARAGEGEELVHEFRAGVAPPAQARGADDEIVVLAEHLALALAVDLGGGGEKQRNPGVGRGAEQDFRFEQVVVNRAGGGAHHEFDAHGGGEVEDEFGARDEFAQAVAFRDAASDHLEAGIVAAGGKVGFAAGG
jgi:hypothetical protein